ncbi:elongation factor 1-gamma-like [Camellia sinensis]|uniref:Uncharacterized protein n=1 Tax=Camellia sinensis var. sinensis TaxID=542762 RepID=A0A4S4DFL8_CAMSN|nr:elongation factor 1-gamma-like [Camellia sinensis]THG01522.1 hypothetical protein TEA_020778 [Camellia sinensis var. sinensis]
MALILHAGKTNKNAFKTLIAAEYSGVQVELAPNFEMGVSNKTPKFIKMNPIGKVPVLETPDGPIFKSNAIARYVARLKSDNPLCGSSLTECAHVEQWIDFASLEVDANILNWFRPRMGHTVYLPPAEEAAISALKRGLGALNTYLASNTYLVGHAVTLADIIMTCNLYLGFTRLMTSEFTDSVNILHVYDTVFHGFSAALTTSQAGYVLQHPSILATFADRRRQLHTTRSPQFLDLRNQRGLWSESDYGSDVIIGLFDTGIWPERRSFLDLNLGLVPSWWKGVC